MSCPSSYFLRYRCVPCESLVVGDKPIVTMDSSEEWKEQLSSLKNAIYLNDLTVTARNGKKKRSRLLFSFKKEKKNAPKKFIGFLILLPNSSWSDVKSPLEHKYGIEKYDTCRLWYRYGYYTSRYYFMLVLLLSFSPSRSHQ